MIKIIPEQVDDDIPGVLLCSHGHLAEGIADAVKMIYGECKNLAVIGLEESDDVAGWGDELEAAVKRFSKGAIVLIDLFGGTPGNQCLLKTVQMVKAGEPVCAVAGMNLGMVLEVLAVRETERFGRIAEIAVEAGKQAVSDCLLHFR